MSFTASASALDVNGNVASNITWGPGDNPVFVNVSSLVVNPGVRLTIEPGVTVRVRSGGTIDVQGMLDATGTATATANVIFEGQSGTWKVLQFRKFNTTLRATEDFDDATRTYTIRGAYE